MALENLKDLDRTLFGTKVLNWNTQKIRDCNLHLDKCLC